MDKVSTQVTGRLTNDLQSDIMPETLQPCQLWLIAYRSVFRLTMAYGAPSSDQTYLQRACSGCGIRRLARLPYPCLWVAASVSRLDKVNCQRESHLAKSVHFRRRHQAQSHHRPARAARCPTSRNIYRQPEVSRVCIIAISRMVAYRSRPPMNAIASSITQSFSCCH